MVHEELRAVLWRELTHSPAEWVEPCSRHFRWHELIVCGPTARSLLAAGGEVTPPLMPESWRMLAGLAQEVLDPAVDTFGEVDLTYGFAGPQLTRRIAGRIAVQLDQHAALEVDKRGQLICQRGGAAADFSVPGTDSDVLLAWLLDAVPFDRIYYYGPQSPIHVSWVPETGGRLCWEMVLASKGRRIPRPLRRGSLAGGGR